MKTYTAEQRNMFPSHIGVIERKDKPYMLVDSSSVKSLIQDLNSNDFAWIDQYNTTLHKFEVQNIYISKVTDKERQMIEKFVYDKDRNYKEKTPLSFNDCIKCLSSQNQSLPSTSNEFLNA